MVLEQIQPVCVAEQKFLNSFFHFERIEGVPEEIEEADTFFMDKADEYPKKSQASSGSGDAGGTDVGSHNLLNQLFAALLHEIEDFIDFGERQDC